MGRENGHTPISPALEQWAHNSRRGRKGNANRRTLLLSIQAIANALLIGILAKGLVILIALITNLAFYGRISVSNIGPAGNALGFWVIFVPVAGAVLVGLMAKFGSQGIRGHGIPEAMEKIILEESRIPPALTFLKPLSAALSIGTGGPFGAEGPIIATGGALGSLTGQFMHISPGERKTILAAGACAGMAAIFGSPLAAILLAIELLLFEYSAKTLIPVALACITGAGMHLLLFEKAPVFQMPEIPVPSNQALWLYVLMGIVIGICASAVSRSVYLVEELFEKLPIHWMWWPALGAIAVGVIGYWAPFTMGVGYDNIRELLTGSLPLTLLFSLCFLKYFSWVVALGSGTSGGTLAPLFTIGGALGALLGLLLLNVYPSAGINLSTAALIGMAAMFAGASRALLTSIIFALETTGQMNGLLPLIGSCTAAYFMSFVLMKSSIMTEKIERRGVRTPRAYEPDLLKSESVGSLVSTCSTAEKNDVFVYRNDDVAHAAELMGRYGLKSIQVYDKPGHPELIGEITAMRILTWYSQQQQKLRRYQSPAGTRRMMAKGRSFWSRLLDRNDE